MPSYHFAAQIIKRSKGRSAISAAAYRAAGKLRDDAGGWVFDYTRKRGVAFSTVLLPTGAAQFLADREKLWNFVEHVETRKDAQLAREVNISLPHELSGEQRKALLLGFVWEQFVHRGMVADVAIHEPVPERGDDPRNFHAHVMLTMRRATSTGLLRVKTREWNSNKLVEEWRETWADHQNRALERAGIRERVDHRTLVVQKRFAAECGDRMAELILDRVPGIHVGPRPKRLKRPPISRDLFAGPFRFWGEASTARRRVVQYRKLDRGSRAEHNLNIGRLNLQRLIWKLVNLHPRLFTAPRPLLAVDPQFAMAKRELNRLAQQCRCNKSELLRAIARMMGAAGRGRWSRFDAFLAPGRPGRFALVPSFKIGRRRARRPTDPSTF